MKIVLIQGGLGNQMFQYAFYRALQVQFPNEEIKVDLSFYKKHHCHNGYELEKIFNLKPSIAKESEIVRCKQSKTYIEQEIKYYLEVFDFEGDVYFNGYWQSEKYFFDIKEQIKKDFSFPMLTEAADKKLSLQIQESNAVSVHIRRGDYVNNPYHEVCNIQYYEHAIKEIKKKVKIPIFFILSNDIAWCKEHFKDDNIVFIERKKQADAYRDMQMISLCKHHIIVNSSFSWWGSYLSNHIDGLKIAPKQWFAIGTFSYYINDILPNGFTKLDVLPEPLVSVIVPVYNVEEYLRECLDSIINQTYTNLEIIIVNDCSLDNSQSIIDEYIKTDKRIQCIKHEKNKGLGEARNTGMAIAKGEYISFIDSDDYVDHSFIAKMLALILKDRADVAMCTYNAFDDVTKHIHPAFIFNINHTKESESFNALDTKGDVMIKHVVTPVWNKFYRLTFLKDNHIQFPALIYEDTSWGVEVLYTAKKIIYTNRPLMWYRDNRKKTNQNKIQLSQVSDAKTAIDIITNFELVYQFLNNKKLYKDLKTQFVYFVYIRILWILHRLQDSAFEGFYIHMQNFLKTTNIDPKNNSFLDENSQREIEYFINLSPCEYLLSKKRKLELHRNIPSSIQSSVINDNQSLWSIIKNRLREKLVHEKWAKYPKAIRYIVYGLKLIKIVSKKIFLYIIAKIKK